MGGNSGPSGVVLLSLLPWFGLLLSEMVGLPCHEDRRFLGVAECDVDVSPRHIDASSARASKFFLNLGTEEFDPLHLHFQTLLQLQGLRREETTKHVRRTEEHEFDVQLPRCLVSAGIELGVPDVCSTSFNPFGSAGMMGMNRLAEDGTA